VLVGTVSLFLFFFSASKMHKVALIFFATNLVLDEVVGLSNRRAMRN
jgi:hypothetical protein